jgi:glycosyltransferase involved in cell wall biosynthesis
MKVSVITVCYNARDVIETALRSIQAQTCPDIEKVIVDGGSSDGTQDIVTRYLNPGDKFVSGKDGGIYDAMNKGIAMATGDIIYFLNADDSFCDANVLSDVAVKFTANAAADLIYGKVIWKEMPRIPSRYRLPFQFTSVCDFMDNTICHQAVFARKALFETIGYFDCQYRYAADCEWLLKAFKHAPRAFVFFERDIAFYYYLGRSYQQGPNTENEKRKIFLRHFPLPMFVFYLVRYVWLRDFRKFLLSGKI